MRRSATAVLAALCFAVGGCSTGGAETTETPSGSDAPGAEVLIWADEQHAAAIEDAGAAYEASTGVVVKVQHVDLTTIKERIETLAPQGQGPDLFLGASSWVGDLADGRLIVPFDLGETASSFAEVAVASLSHGGSTYGVPLETENLALLRNTALAPEAPRSIEEMARLGLSLKQKKKSILPIALPVGNFGDAYHWYPLYSAAGGYLFGQLPDGSYDQEDLGVGRSGSIAAAEQLAAFTKQGVLDPEVTGTEALAAFTSGRAPYLIGGPWSVGPAQQAGIPLAVEAIPNSEDSITARSQALVSTAGMMVSAFARNPDTARAFLRDAIMTTAFMDATFALTEAPPAWEESYQKAATDPIVKAFGDYARLSTPIPNLAVMTRTWTILSQAQLDVMEGAKPKRTMVRAGADIQKVIDAA